MSATPIPETLYQTHVESPVPAAQHPEMVSLREIKGKLDALTQALEQVDSKLDILSAQLVRLDGAVKATGNGLADEIRGLRDACTQLALARMNPKRQRSKAR